MDGRQITQVRSNLRPLDAGGDEPGRDGNSADGGRDEGVHPSQSTPLTPHGEDPDGMWTQSFQLSPLTPSQTLSVPLVFLTTNQKQSLSAMMLNLVLPWGRTNQTGNRPHLLLPNYFSGE